MLDLLALQDQVYSERGVPRYVANHAKALLRRPGAVRRLFLNPAGKLPIKLDPALQTSPLLRWHSATDMRAALAEGPAAYFLMSPFDTDTAVLTTYLPARVPLIATLYDLIPLLHPDQYLVHPLERARYMASLALLRRADLVLAISEATRRDAMTHLGLAPGRVTSIGAGVDTSFQPAAPGAPRPTAPFAELGLRGPYVMAVLGDDARKNLSALLEAMVHLPSAVGHDLSLVVIGNYDMTSRGRFHTSPAGQALGARLVFSGRVPDDWLIPLYQHAALHVFPSLYEGFGLPAAEAAACGCPSITSNTSSLPEVLETPEATFDPRQPAQLAALITRVQTDVDFRSRLMARGLAAAQRHTWDAVADRTLAALDQAGDLLRRRTRLPVPRQPRVALVGPMPPTRSGIADYNARIVNALQARCRLDLFLSHHESRAPAAWRGGRCYRTRSLLELVEPACYDAVIYTFGNSEHHQETLDAHLARPGWVWLHDVQLHDLLFRRAYRNRTTAEADAFLREALHDAYGTRMPDLPSPGTPVGLEFLRERSIGYLEPVVRQARGILLHSAHAADLLRHDLAPNAHVPPVSILPLAFPEVTRRAPRVLPPPWVVAHFGILGPPKMPDLIIRAFAALRTPDVKLVFVGPVWDKYLRELQDLVTALKQTDRVVFAGDVSAEDYAGWLRRAHVTVQLRSRSNGESSAALNDAIAAGLPAITNLQSTQDWPDCVVHRLPVSLTPDALRDAIDGMLDTRRLTLQSEAGQAFAVRHSADHVADDLLHALGLA